MSNTKKFNWGWMETARNEFCRGTENEILIRHDYETVFKVEENDIVVDIGASAGLFAYDILKNKPSKIYCLEPQKDVFDLLIENVGDNKNVTCINSGIGLYNEKRVITNYEACMAKKDNNVDETCNFITFKTFIDENKIDKIDFLKIDCEGGEYDIFTPDNFDWIKKNVGKIAAEMHLNTSEEKQKFVKFRNNFLMRFADHQVYSFSLKNINGELLKDHFIHAYQYVYIFINNKYAF